MRLVALIAVLALVSVAPAAEQAWFTLAGAGPAGAGSALVLPTGGTYTLDVYINAVDNVGFDIVLQGPGAAAPA